METKHRVRKFLGTVTDESVVADTDNIFEKGIVNSLFALQLLVFIEKEFDVTIGNDELDIENFCSINAITTLVDSKR